MMTTTDRIRAALAAGERPADADVLAVCADAERYAWLRNDIDPCGLAVDLRYWLRTNYRLRSRIDIDAAIDAAIREPK